MGAPRTCLRNMLQGSVAFARTVPQGCGSQSRCFRALRRNALDRTRARLQTAHMFDPRRVTKRLAGHCLVLAVLLGCCSCDRTEESTSTNQPAVSSQTSAAVAPKPMRSGVGAPRGELKIAWDAPRPWVAQTLQARDVRRAAYTYPKQAGDSEDAELGVYYFGPSVGGDVDPNLKRWAGQFGKAVSDGQVTKKSVGAVELTLFEIEGTYQPGRPMAPKPPKPGFAMLAAIAQLKSSGNYFFKLTGPKASVEAARVDFMKLLDSLKEKSPG